MGSEEGAGHQDPKHVLQCGEMLFPEERWKMRKEQSPRLK